MDTLIVYNTEMLRPVSTEIQSNGGVHITTSETSSVCTTDHSDQKIATLFVDDEPALLEVAKEFIENEGNVHVDIAESVRAALDVLNTQKYDAIVSDYQMPGMNGIEFLKALRERNDNTPFILFTGKGREEIVIEALNNGADFYLQKGGDLKSQFAELTNMIRQLVSQRRSEMALRESEERYRSFINNFKGIAFRAGLDSIPIFFHGAVKAITGYTEEEFTEGRMRWSRVVHPDDLPTFLSLSEDLIKTPGFSTVREYRIVHKDGQIRWMLESVANIVDDSGKIQAVEGVMHDITDTKTAEEAITHNIEHFKAIIENTSDIIAVVDQDRIIRYASPSVTRTLGYESQELMDARLLDLIHPDDIDFLEETISKVFTGEQVEATKNFRIRNKTGSWVLLEATTRLSDVFDRGPRIIVNARETIEPRRTDDTLASNDWEFLESVEGTMDGIAIIQDSVLKCVNKRLLEIGGYAVEEVLGKDFTDFIWPDEVPRAAEHNRKRMARDHFLSVHETVLKRKDGTKQHVELTAGAIMYEGSPADFLIVHDISERKGIERELLDSRETYRAIFENTGTATIIAEEDMTISMANKEFETLSGCSKQDIEGKSKWTEFVVKEDLPKMMEFHRLRRIDRGASPLRYEFKFLDKNQNVHDIQLSVDVIKGTKRSVASLQDVTDLKRIGRELGMQNQNQRMLLDNIETMVWYAVDPETYGMVNRARAEFIGKRREELEGKKLREVISVKEECENCIASNTAAFEGKETVHTEEWITTSKGKRLVSVTKTPMFDENGNVEFIVCTGIDITERKSAEEDLRQSEKRYRLLVDSATEAIVVAQDGMLRLVNPMAVAMTGFSEQELMSKPFPSFVHPDDRAMVVESHQRRLRGEAVPDRYAFRLLAKDGSIKWMEIGAAMIDWEGRPATLNFLTDITERKRAELELKSAQAELKEAHHLAHIGTWDWLIEDDTVTWSEELCDIVGWDPSLPAPAYAELPRHYTRASWESLSCAVKGALTTGEPYNLELEVVRPDGSIRWTNATGSVKRDGKGKVIGLHGMVQDITESKMLGKELHDKSNEQALLLDNIQTMVYFATDPETHGKMNQWRADFFGKSKEEMEGRKISEIMPKDLADDAIAGNRYVFETKKPYHGLEWYTNWKGEKHLFSVMKVPKLDEKGNVEFVICSAHDVTDLEETRNALSLANNKLNLYGSILRHDTLNKLSVILGNAGLAEEQFQDTRLKRYLENIQRAAKAIGKEMEFAKEYEDVGAKAPVWNSLGNCLSKASTGLDLRDISLTVDLDGIEILADPMLDRVFHNLIDNVCRHGGEVKTIKIRHERSGDNLKLICEDDGVGVAEENREGLFSQGHGLQMVRDILAMTDMTIAEKGEPGKGARFEICVPAGNFRFID